jgi:very-short-patch-repair endonuclease
MVKWDEWLLVMAGLLLGLALLQLTGWFPPVVTVGALLLIAGILVWRARRISSTDRVETAPTVPNPTTEKASRYREIAWHGLTLRSQSEVKIAKALDLKGVLFIAGAKIRLKTERGRQTREVDFVIGHEGKWGILEVDGPHHADSTEADAWRDARFAEHGLPVQRFPSMLCYQEPAQVVESFLADLD